MEGGCCRYNHIAEGNINCNICKTNFKWVGIISGITKPTVVENVKDIDQLADVVVVKRNVNNKDKTEELNLEVIAKCPDCNARNKINYIYRLRN